ncbi:MAG: type II CAAX endopeptidase family protein [Anaerolineales bacterium]
METTRSNLVRRYPVAAFYVLAFVISWLGWFPQTLHARGIFPFDSPLFALLGGAGPTLAAVLVIWALKGKDGPRELFAPLAWWRASWGWWAFAFLGWFGIAAVALGVGALFGGRFDAVLRFNWAAVPAIFVTMLLSNVWEEIGWRGFALPRLQERYGDLAIAVIMGLLWSLWHLPLYLNPTSPMSQLPWVGDVVFSVALTVIYTWLYNGTGRSLLFVSVLHAMSNTVAFALAESGAFSSSYGFVVGVTAAVAAAIVLACGPRRFRRAG